MSQACKQNFAIKGMSCAACKARVERAVAPLPGVESVAVQLLQNSMTVLFNDKECSVEKIEAAVSKAGYEASPIHSSKELLHMDDGEVREKKKRLIASVILTLLLLALSMGPMVGIDILPLAQANAYSQLGLCLMVMALNIHYFKNGFKALLHLAPNMDSLVAIGAGASFLSSCFSMIFIQEGDLTSNLHRHFSLYFEGVATILTLVSVGKYLETKAKHRAVDAISKLYELAPNTVVVRKLKKHATKGADPYEEVTVPLEAVAVGDEVVLRSGDRVGVDGVVIEGNGFFDESAITGEAMQVKKAEGDKVISATFLRHGYVVFKVEKVGNDTTLAKIIALVDDANRQKAPIARLADRVAFYFVPAVILIALITGVVWLYEGAPPTQALSFAVSVLVVSCPCALGLATPTAIMVATGRAASLGVLFKSPEALENLQHVDIMVFDKTGTITEGKMRVLACKRYAAEPEEMTHIIHLTQALEQRSEHPIAQALVSYCQQELSTLKLKGDAAVAAAADAKLEVTEFINHEGKGVEAVIGGVRYFMGSTTFMNQVLYKDNTEAQNLSNYREESVNVTVHLFTPTQHLVSFALGDEIKRGAADVVELLRNFGVHSIIVSGDSVRVVANVAEQVGITTYKAACLPQDKSDFISLLKDKGHHVAMMGDGINDAPSLTTSDVGISIAGSTDIAKSCADVILMKDNLYSIVSALMLSRLTLSNIKENLFWAFIYNIVCIPVAAGVFFDSLGLKLDPMLAACLMSLSSVCVVSNALRLKRHSLNFQLPNGEVVRAEVADNDGATSVHVSSSIAEDEAAAAAQQGAYSTDPGNEKQSPRRLRLERSAKEKEMDAELAAAGAQLVGEEVQAPNLSYDAATLGTTQQKAEAAVQQASDSQSDAMQVSPDNSRSAAGAEAATYGQTKMVKLVHINGMHCEHCQKSVTKALSAVAGVSKVDVSLEFKTARVECADSVTDAQLTQAVVDDGFEVTSIDNA